MSKLNPTRNFHSFYQINFRVLSFACMQVCTWLMLQDFFPNFPDVSHSLFIFFCGFRWKSSTILHVHAYACVWAKTFFNMLQNLWLIAVIEMTCHPFNRCTFFIFSPLMPFLHIHIVQKFWLCWVMQRAHFFFSQTQYLPHILTHSRAARHQHVMQFHN